MYRQDSVMTLTCHAACILTCTSRTVQWPSFVTSCCIYSDIYLPGQCHGPHLSCCMYSDRCGQDSTMAPTSDCMLHVLWQDSTMAPTCKLHAACTLTGTARTVPWPSLVMLHVTLCCMYSDRCCPWPQLPMFTMQHNSITRILEAEIDIGLLQPVSHTGSLHGWTGQPQEWQVTLQLYVWHPDHTHKFS